MIRFFCLGLFFISTALFAITPEELARLSGKGAADKRRVEQQLNLGDLQYQISVDNAKSQKIAGNKSKKYNQTKSVDIAPPDLVTEDVDQNSKIEESPANKKTSSSKKYSKGASGQTLYYKQEHPQNLRNKERQKEKTYYQAQPSASINKPSTKKTVTYSDAVVPDGKKYFGIRRGTWIKAELRRDVNNAEPGDVELYLSQEIYGKKHTLPVDTQLFANKAFNSATQRLDLITTYAITPSGREFVLKARIYDTFKVSGLNGIIDADDSKIAERGATSGLAALGTGVLGEVSGTSVVGKSLSKGGQSVIRDQQRASDIETKRQITIFVAPQPLLLRVEETF